jgi:gliding motility-associated-like protein
MHNRKAAFIFVSLLLATVLKSFGQCSGNVIFKEDFGGNGSSQTVGFPLPAGVTDYAFQTSADVNDGQYSIRNTTASRITNGPQFGTWLIGRDHTGDGYMMIVNASFDAGKFYQAKVDNLCPGSKLSFSAWIANLEPTSSTDPLDPIVKFEITSAVSGQVLGSFTTATITRHTSLTWEQYGFSFTLPSGETSVILTMYNNQIGGLGNDLTLDDIEFNLCGPQNSVSIQGGFQNGNTTCQQSSITMNGTVEPGFYASPVYQWQSSTDSLSWTDVPGATQTNYSIPSVQVSDGRYYRLLIAESGSIGLTNCRTVSKILHLIVFGPQPVNFQNKNQFCERDTMVLNCITPASHYLWTGPAGFTANTQSVSIPNISVSNQGLYLVDLVTAGGCQSSGITNIGILPNTLNTPLDDTKLLCNGETVSYNAYDPSIVSYLWSTGARNPDVTLTDAGIYWLEVRDANCRLRDSVVITTKVTPVVHIGNDTTVCVSETLLLNAEDSQADSYLWQDGSTMPYFEVSDSGRYSVTVTNGCGSASGEVLVNYMECSDQVFVPTAFTPNGDHLNDVLKGRAYFRVETYNFRVFNRWGQLVFSTTSIQSGWDGRIAGKEAPSGNYVWTIIYRRNGVQRQEHGTVVLIR